MNDEATKARLRAALKATGEKISADLAKAEKVFIAECVKAARAGGTLPPLPSHVALRVFEEASRVDDGSVL
jgi:hypothetical protein